VKTILTAIEERIGKTASALYLAAPLSSNEECGAKVLVLDFFLEVIN
jgi:hypothetical protein